MILVDRGSRLVIAHRGASGLAPENTVAAFELGLEQGADALELDIRLAACGTPVVVHDPTLDRTTAWTGSVHTRTAAELGECDAGYRFSGEGNTFPWRSRGVTIPTLEQVLARFPEVPLLIELKTIAVALPAMEVLRRHGAAKRVMVASFLEPAVVPFRAAGFQTSASRRGIFMLWALSTVGLHGRSKDHAYSVPERYRDWITVPTPAFIRSAGRLGCPVHVWTVNDRRKARELWDRGVTGIITNFPAEMVAERGTLP